jgi:hypothetical protein
MTIRGGPWRGALSGRSGGAGWLAVGSERWLMVQGGGLRLSGARGGCLGAARPAAAAVEVCGAAAWWHGRARHDALRQLRAGVRERGESCELLRLEQREDKAHVTWGRRRPRRPVATALSARYGVLGTVTEMRCRVRAIGNRVRAVKRWLRLTSRPSSI